MTTLPSLPERPAVAVVVGRARDRCHVLVRQSLVLLRHKPSDGHVRDVEAPGDLNERLTSSATTKGFCALVGGKGWLTTKPNASSLRSSAALCGSGEDEMALIFRQPT